MVSYRKRGNAWQYEISYKDINGQYKKLRKSGFLLKSEAILAASKMQAEHPSLTSIQSGNESLVSYYRRWIKVYKQGAVTPITYNKYENTGKHIAELFGTLKLKDLSKFLYQEKLNQFAQTHARRTVSCFHKQLRACLLEALDERIITADPTRKAVVTGIEPPKHPKALSYQDWKRLVAYLSSNRIDQMTIYIAAVTGMRYGEVVGLTAQDIDFKNQKIHVNKAWDYKYKTGFMNTKTPSSVRDISIDQHTVKKLKEFFKTNPTTPHQPIFMTHTGHILVSAEINKSLTLILEYLNIPRITFHGLRHTHASILLYKGVSVLSVSRRLGHSSITTTQSTYLHIIKELETQDQDRIISILNQASN